jgi:ubiquinone/menaquinone biosynthesis C-methylase UbiE
MPDGAEDDGLNRAEAVLASMMTADRVHRAVRKVGRVQAHIVGEIMVGLRAELSTLVLARDDAQLLWSVALDDVTDLVADHLSATSTIDPERYYADLAWAFLRGRLPGAGDGEQLLAAAREAGLRWNKFKRLSGLPRVTQVLSMLEGIEPASMLDIGSGRGAFLWPLVAQFDQLAVTAVDRLAHRVADIEAVHAGGIARVRGQLGDVTALPFGDASFDVVTVLEVLEHLEDPAAAARETMRVAARFVIASVPSREDDNPEHIRLFTKATLTELFERAGAARVQVSYVLNHMVALVTVANSADPDRRTVRN